MLIAVIGEVAGNFRSFEAALKAIENEGIQTILQTGNLVLGESGSNESVLLAESRGLHCVLGEQDRKVVRFQKKKAMIERRMDKDAFDKLRHAHESLRPNSIEWLQRLPRERRIELEGIGILLCGGAPGAANQVIEKNTPAVRLQRYRENTDCRLILCGGNGSPFHHRVADTLFVHPGPVTPNQDRAAYTRVDTEELPWRVETVEIDCV